MRQIRQPVVELVMECCTVLRDVQTCSAVEAKKEDVKEAEMALEALNTLQEQVRSGDAVLDETITERNELGQRCVKLIESAMQNRPKDPGAPIRVRAAEVLNKLRITPNDKVPRQENFDGLRRLCDSACARGENFATALGLNSAQSKACDEAVTIARNALPSSLLREYGYESAADISMRDCIDPCKAALTAEMTFLEGGARYLTERIKLAGVFSALETALDTVIRLKAPDVSLVHEQHKGNFNFNLERKKWDARVLLAENETNEATLRKDRGVWQRNTRDREKAARHELTAWLQYTGTHYPELLRSPSVTACFTWEWELKCAAQGLLRKGDKIKNYQHVKMLSEKKDRSVRLVTDFEGKHVVVKSYILTTSSHFSHFMKTCSKLGGLRGAINIVPIIGVFTEEHFGHVLMYNYKSGDLEAWMQNHPKRDPKLCLRIAHQVVAAVESLHTRDIVHCNLNPENIFLTSKLEAVLGDIDDLRDADCTITTAVVVTRKFEAPEIRSRLVSRFDKSADIHSLGLVLKIYSVV
ncbi:serine/threonine protein kinase [Sphaeroforma arctica JP610]|uniref:non-specific serine/threonine protein kinase n=1 Tax=Sphaeroforma arctica JP610 TaxID=667725 RepID=A0A0L0G7K2_9EUKA|nr:serine/threonine protein kinase [Sphaeroforma arctica JP610]KNC84861.1 serine/threonine protein kinase [Sphaeroforma arctica JP610]|eukprot:XP_014158763.1 serine/threonine protein kinase [Sphaeroforma arctica JP610]